MSVATLLEAVKAGATRVDAAISSLSMGTSHSPTETLVEILRGTGFDTGLDVGLLVRIAAEMRRIRRNYRQFESSFLGADTRILSSQVPGGMLSNLESQLREQGKLDKLDAVLGEIAVVQRDFGYPPLVTPTSQIVGTQAVFNVLFGRYERLLGESRDLLAGRYGRTPAEPDPALLARALADARLDARVSHRPADDIPNELERIAAELRARLQVAGVSMEDTLTYAMFPQVALQFFKTRGSGPAAPKAEPEKRPPSSGSYAVAVDGREYAVRRKAAAAGDGTEFEVDGRTFRVSVRDSASAAPSGPASGASGPGGEVCAPMPGDVMRLAVENGSRVEAGQTVVILEAMKLQMEIKSRHSGAIEFKVAIGQQVKADQLLALVK
jgi:oxaloacetate decarboxylase alpha subunit